MHAYTDLRSEAWWYAERNIRSRRVVRDARSMFRIVTLRNAIHLWKGRLFMASILEEFARGNISPDVGCFKNDGHYGQTMKTFCGN